MNINNFKLLIDTYGTSSERWPNKIKHESIEFLEKDPFAKQYLQQCAKLDEWIKNNNIDEVSSSLQNDIFELMDHYSQRPLSHSEEHSLRSIYALLALCALTGFIFAKAPFLLHIFQYENATFFIQIEQLAFGQYEE